MKLFNSHFYRKKVTGIIIDKDNEYLIDQLIDYGPNHWNFPGGGVEKGESEEKALLRELKEELGTDKFKIVKKSKNFVTYNWPIDFVIRRLISNKKIWFGQRQRHFLVKFIGKREDIIINLNELREIKWVKRKDLKKYLNFKNQLEETEKELGQF